MSSNAAIFQNIHDHIRRVADLDQPYELMILNFSRLMPYYRQGKFITAARSYIEDHYAVQGKVAFGLANLDIVLIYQQPEPDQREQMFFHLRELFAFDLLMNMPTYGKVDGLFLQVYNLSEQKNFVLDELKNLEKTLTKFEADRKPKKRRFQPDIDHDSMSTYVNPSDGTLENSTVLDPTAEVARVSALAGRYRNLDIGSLLQRELVIKHNPDSQQPFVFAFSRLDKALHVLMRYKDNRVDADDALMNRYLEHVLQFRLLDYLIKNTDRKIRRDITLPVHPELVLDRRFTEFKDMYTKGEHSRIILQFSLADIYSDYRLFFFARQHLRRMGFRLALAEVGYEVLSTVDLDALGMDFLFLRMDADWAFLTQEVQDNIAQEVSDIGPSKIILTNCQQDRSLDFARKMGVQLLSGAVVRNHFDRSLAGQDFLANNGAESLTLGQSMQQRSRS